MWNHFCVTWQLHNKRGDVRIFLNGEMIGKETFTSESVARGIAGSDEVFESYFIVGQDPDVIGPPYEEEDLFQGMITELNVWDRVLDQKTILELGSCKQFSKGNIISWNKDLFNIIGPEEMPILVWGGAGAPQLKWDRLKTYKF